MLNISHHVCELRVWIDLVLRYVVNCIGRGRVRDIRCFYLLYEEYIATFRSKADMMNRDEPG